MPELDTGVLTAIVAAIAVLVLVLLVLVIGLSRRLRALQQANRRAFRGVEVDVLEALGRHADELRGIREAISALDQDTTRLHALQRSNLSRVGMVRYDAFDDMGGALSFSAALLDDHGDGLVVSAINGRTETRCYAKPISGGVSTQNLTGEEHDAIEAAVQNREPTVLPPDRRRRRRAS